MVGFKACVRAVKYQHLLLLIGIYFDFKVITVNTCLIIVILHTFFVFFFREAKLLKYVYTNERGNQKVLDAILSIVAL